MDICKGITTLFNCSITKPDFHVCIFFHARGECKQCISIILNALFHLYHLSSHPSPVLPFPYSLLFTPHLSSQRHRSLLCCMIEILRLVESQARLELWPIRTWRSRGSLSGWGKGEVWLGFLHGEKAVKHS